MKLRLRVGTIPNMNAECERLVEPAGLELVVARHTEDLRWLRRVPKAIRVTVYDKGTGPRAGAIPLPNVGREAHTYLHHLTARYDALAEVTVFAQGRPFDHVHDFHARLRALAGGTLRVPGFLWLGFLVDWDDADGRRLFVSWSKNPAREKLPMRQVWSRVMGRRPLPPRFVFFPGAHFAVMRAQIHQRPRSFYARALRAAELPHAAHCFERMWDLVFGARSPQTLIPESELPKYYKPIRRLAAQETRP